LKLLKRFGNFRGNYIRRPSKRDCESLWKKMTGKPYSGKLNVRFDEGELEIRLSPLRQFSTLPVVFPLL
jgi:CTP-dependent riboflavin kinase